MLQRETTMLEFLLLSFTQWSFLTIIVQTWTHFSISMCFGTPTYFCTSSFVRLHFLTLTRHIGQSVSQIINNVWQSGGGWSRLLCLQGSQLETASLSLVLTVHFLPQPNPAHSYCHCLFSRSWLVLSYSSFLKMQGGSENLKQNLDKKEINGYTKK